jgi:hypothetical protein
MAEEKGTQQGEQQKEDRHSDPYSYFKNIEHEMTNRDAAFHLLDPGKTLAQIAGKAVYRDDEQLIRFSQCLAKLDECEIGEHAPPEYASGYNLVLYILTGSPAIEGYNRELFTQALGRLYAPSAYELRKTGKVSGSKEQQKKRWNVLKNKEEKQGETSQ